MYLHPSIYPTQRTSLCAISISVSRINLAITLPSGLCFSLTLLWPRPARYRQPANYTPSSSVCCGSFWATTELTLTAKGGKTINELIKTETNPRTEHELNRRHNQQAPQSMAVLKRLSDDCDGNGDVDRGGGRQVLTFSWQWKRRDALRGDGDG